MRREVADSVAPDGQSLCRQQRPFQVEIATISTERASCGDDAMVRQPWPFRRSHDRADRARGARAARQPGHVTVGGDSSGRNPADDLKHSSSKWRKSGHGAVSVSARDIWR